MDRTKEKVYRKQKLWKIFTLKRPRFLQKMLAVGVSASLMLSMVPKIGVFAEGEPDKFITAAKANHWGRSDLRAYLNGVEKVDNTLPLDTTHTDRQDSGYYESQFSDAEYALVQPFKYHTNEFVENSQEGTVTSYDTTDRFWLPSGNDTSNKVLSWGAADVSRDSDYAGNFASAHVIPISYWPAGVSSNSWLRSARYDVSYEALVALRGCCAGGSFVYEPVYGGYAVAGAFKLDLSSVLFASAASAASLAAEGGSRKFKIERSSNFGRNVAKQLPDYGMYLRTAAGGGFSFTPQSLAYDSLAKTLTVSYDGGDEDQFVVVQAFKEDNLEDGTTSYEAAAKISAGQTSVSLDVSNWGLDSLDGYTLKVWMEDASGGSSLAAATAPVTFVGSGGSITKTETGAATNQRVFAMKNDLQTSWGDLQALKASNETAYNNVIAGKGQDGSAGDSTNSIHGLNPTNQKIYFGKYAVKDDDGNFVKDSSGNQVYAPLEFWIAGRETYAGDPAILDGDGTIDKTGNIMTLYQAKSVKLSQFASSWDDYKCVPSLSLAGGQSVPYSGSVQGPGGVSYTFNGTDLGAPTSFSYEYRLKGSDETWGDWTGGLPTNAGTYEVRGVAAATSDYERVTSQPVTFTINPKSLASATIAIDQSSMVYTGKKLEPTIKSVTVDGITVPSTAYDMTVSDATAAGEEVTVTLTATDGGNFTGSASTTFTITKATPDDSGLSASPTINATYGQTLGDIKEGLAAAVGSFLDVDGSALAGSWAWEKDDDTAVGNVGENKFTALFAPKDTSNYDWTTLDGWDADKEALVVDVAVTVSVDTSKWGDAQKRDADGKTQYVDSSGKTSIEISEENLSEGDVLWVLEESDGTSAWYGLDLSSGAFDLAKGLRFYVQWLSPSDAGYAEVYAQLDDAQKSRVEDDNGWIFLIGVEDPDGNKVQPAQPTKVYVQIGDDWDLKDLNAYYISSGGDRRLPVRYIIRSYPGPGTSGIFGEMTLSHFSPYIIFDELTDAEKAALGIPGTGDISTELLISGLAIVLVSSLGVMLRLITNKNKFEE